MIQAEWPEADTARLGIVDQYGAPVGFSELQPDPPGLTEEITDDLPLAVSCHRAHGGLIAAQFFEANDRVGKWVSHGVTDK
ncbi:hypothetical protein D9M68_744160 [compost metagenome]